MHDGFKVYRAGYNTLLDYLSDFLNSKKRRNDLAQHSENKGPGRFRKIAEKIADKSWRQNYWPDGSQLFLKPGINIGLDIIKSENITHVISVGLPFTCHLIARHLKEKNPQLVWHQDIQDPFSYSKEFWVNNFEKYEQRNITEEKKAFELSDSISVTNHRASEKYIDLFQFDTKKMTVISPLFHKPTSQDYILPALEKNKMHFGFFGSFYEKVRSPQLFLEFLRYIKNIDAPSINKIHFHLIGQQNRFSLSILEGFPELKSNITLHGLMPRANSLELMQHMNFLLNFGNTTDYHLPSKVVDYLFINKPILNIITTNSDSTKLFFKDYSNILNLNLEQALFESQMKTFETFISKERIKSGVNENSVIPYSVSEISEQYLAALKR